MPYHFCIECALESLESAGAPEGRKRLLEISSNRTDCSRHKDGDFVLASIPNILDLDGAAAAQKLGSLLKDVPLYRINMELALDRALTERHGNARIRSALEKAFAGKPLPTTMPPRNDEGAEPDGNLRHPMLGHMNPDDLQKLYLSFLQETEPEKDGLGFGAAILGRHPERFLGFYDGYICGSAGAVRTDILMGFGMRAGHDGNRKTENYTDNGTRKAKKMNLREPQEILWAWLEADDFQERRCTVLHKVMMLPGLTRQPAWVRTDVLSLLEREAMKQVFADNFLKSCEDKNFLKDAPLLRRALEKNAANRVDETLQILLSQIMSTGTGYAGAAGKFAESAAARAAEARRARLV